MACERSPRAIFAPSGLTSFPAHNGRRFRDDVAGTTALCFLFQGRSARSICQFI
jgi:hypothetical protein